MLFYLFSKTNTICKKCAQNVKQFGTVSSYLVLNTEVELACASDWRQSSLAANLLIFFWEKKISKKQTHTTDCHPERWWKRLISLDFLCGLPFLFPSCNPFRLYIAKQLRIISVSLFVTKQCYFMSCMLSYSLRFLISTHFMAGRSLALVVLNEW